MNLFFIPRHILPGIIFLVCGQGVCTRVSGAPTASVNVPGTANPWLAPTGATDASGDSLPAEAPVRVDAITLTAGTNLTFSVSGSVDYSGGTPTDSPDGSPGYFYPHPAQNGLSGVTAVVNGLMGVFIDDSAADPTNANTPAAYDFSDPASVPGGIDFTSIQPSVGQVFFIGNGLNAAGIVQQFTVPTGATHLVLGTMDGAGWYNNTGNFQVTVAVSGKFYR